MTTVTQALREEHRELLPHIERIREVADSVGRAPAQKVEHGIDEVHGFITHHLVPHAHAEDRALYPVVGRVMGAPEATATMTFEHEQVVALTEELESIRRRLGDGVAAQDWELEARRVLYGLYTLVKVHFMEEEEVYLPILDARLPAAEAREMFEEMELAAAEVAGAT